MAGPAGKAFVDDLLHQLSQPLNVILVNAPYIKEHVTDPAGLVMADDLAAASRQCAELFDRLRRAISAL
jgi:hypothetical protein